MKKLVFGELISCYISVDPRELPTSNSCWGLFTLSDVVEDRDSKRNYSNHSKIGPPPECHLSCHFTRLKISNYDTPYMPLIISKTGRKARVGPQSVQLQYHSDSRASTVVEYLSVVPPIIHMINDICGLCCGYCIIVRVITRVSTSAAGSAFFIHT